MNVSAISAVSAMPEIGTSVRSLEKQENVAGSFGTWFSAQVTDVNDKLVEAERGLQLLATGQADNLHQIMIGLEEAKVSLQLLAQIRSRTLEAYQEIMRMQV